MKQGSRDRNRLVQDQAVRSGPRATPDQDQQNLENLEPDRTRINKILKISDQLGPVGPLN